MATVLEKLNWISFALFGMQILKKIGPKSGFFVKFLALLMDSALLNRIAIAGVT